MKDSAGDFFRALGFIDIVVGALALYAAFAWWHGSSILSDVLPSTGTRPLDIALLLCGAALAGKVVLLGAQWGLAFLELAVEARYETQYMKDIETSLMALQKDPTKPSPCGDYLECGAVLASTLIPGLRAQLDTMQNDALLAVSAIILAIPYGALLITRWSEGGGWLVLIASIVLLAARAYYSEAGYVEGIRTGLQVIVMGQTV